MRFDLKVPCKNCPFRTADSRIKFACRERAEEIEEIAYRQGFVCHLSAVETETINEEGDEETFFDFGENSQHCAGALARFISDGYDSTPGTGNDEELFDRLREQLAEAFPLVFDSAEAFLEANEEAA